jgi:hypothetical protein
MSVMVSELYEALRSVGVAEPAAAAAAKAVLPIDARTDLATKADIEELRLVMKADMSDLKAELIKWNVGTLIALTAIYGGLVAALKVFA